MSSCLSGGGRTACAYALDLELIKSHSSSSRSSQTSSPTSTISESSNSPLALSTRKARTARKRPNQTYNEAAVLLSTAYPKVFSTKHITNHPTKLTKPFQLHDTSSIMVFDNESSELLLPFRVIDHLGFPLYRPIIQDKPSSRIEPKLLTNSCEIDFLGNSSSLSEEEFDAESILDEEIEEGIDSIMGNSNSMEESNTVGSVGSGINFPIGLGFGGKSEFGLGMRRGVRPLRHQVDDNGEWWRFPAIDVREISPKFNKVNTSTTTGEKKKQKKKKIEKLVSVTELSNENSVSEETISEELPEPNSSLILKLNYEDVVKAWSEGGSPFPIPVSELGENDSHARLAQIDLFGEGGGMREASVLRYKEKRRTRLFSKKIRYQVRKVNADQRPRMKGRFVRRPNSAGSSKR